MKGLFLGAHSQLAQLLLNKRPWTKLLLHSRTLNELQQIVFNLPKGLHADLFPCDFSNVQENVIDEFQDRLARFDYFDHVVLTAGSWSSYSRFEHVSLEDLYMAWQVNYFYPLSLLKHAINQMPPGTHVYYWTLDVAVKSQPLWTTMQPILVAWETLLQQLAVEQGWLLHPIQTGFIRSPQVLKLFPAGELCVSITALEQAIEYCD